MKNFLSIIIISLLTLLYVPSSLLAANINADKLIGTWNVTAQIPTDVSHKNWLGSITVTKNGNVLSGILNWSSAVEGWHVQENLTIAINGSTVTLQGTEVNIITSPKPDSKYRLDNFTFEYDDINNQTTPISMNDEIGQTAIFTISKT